MTLTRSPSAVGAGLLFTIDEHTPLAKLIGYQILFGIGVGCVMQSFTIALMADVPNRRMIPQAMAVAAFFQRVGGTVGLAMLVVLFFFFLRKDETMLISILCGSVGSVFDNELGKKLAQYAPQVNPIPIRHSVAAIYNFVPPQFRAGVIHAYAKAVRSPLFLRCRRDESDFAVVGFRLSDWNSNFHLGFLICFSHRVS